LRDPLNLERKGKQTLYETIRKVSIATPRGVAKVMAMERGEIVKTIYKTPVLSKTTEYLMGRPGPPHHPGP